MPHDAGLVPDDAPYNSSKAASVVRITVTLLFLAWLIDYVDRLVITLALPSIGKQFHLDKAEQGLILTVFFITYAAFQMPGGVLADKIGARRTMTLALGTWSIFTALTGIAFSYASLLVIRTIFGASEGIFPAASLKALSERISPKQRLTASGFMLCSNSLGGALAPLIAGPAIAAVGWKNSFFLVAVLGIIMAFFIWKYLPKKIVSTAPSRPLSTGFRRIISSPAMWLVAATFCGYDIVLWGLMAWTPSYLMEVRHINVRDSGILTSIPFFIGTATIVIGGFLFDKYFHNKSRLLIIPAMVITGAFLIVMINSHSAGEFIFWESWAVGVACLCFMPIYGVPMRLLPPDISGAGMGLVNFGGQVAGAFTPFIMGAIADHFSFRAAFGFLLFGVVMAVVASFISPQNKDGFESALGEEMRSNPAV